MTDLVIKYAVSTKIKLQALIVAIYLMIISLVIAVGEMTKTVPEYGLYFFIGVVGILIALSLIVSVTISQPKPLVVLNNEVLSLNFPRQRLRTIVSWEQVSHIGIGLSYITMIVDEQQLTVDLDTLRYQDLKILKSKLIEIAESKDIPYNNI